MTTLRIVMMILNWIMTLSYERMSLIDVTKALSDGRKTLGIGKAIVDFEQTAPSVEKADVSMMTVSIEMTMTNVLSLIVDDEKILQKFLGLLGRRQRHQT